MRLLHAWFLPREDDVLGELSRQAEAADEAVRLFASWAAGTSAVEATSARLRELRQIGEERRRAVHASIRASFSTPLDAEDLFELAERLAEVIDAAYTLVREAQLTDTETDPGLLALAAAAEHVSAQLLRAIRLLPRAEAAAAVDEATVWFHKSEHAYRHAVVSLQVESDVQRELRRRELYRRAEHLTAALSRVGRRTWYAVAKVG